MLNSSVFGFRRFVSNKTVPNIKRDITRLRGRIMQAVMRYCCVFLRPGNQVVVEDDDSKDFVDDDNLVPWWCRTIHISSIH